MAVACKALAVALLLGTASSDKAFQRDQGYDQNEHFLNGSSAARSDYDGDEQDSNNDGTRGYRYKYHHFTTSCRCSAPVKKKNWNILDWGRIVNGEVVDRREDFPMVVGIGDPTRLCSYCVGSILTEHHILTAAHCVYDNDTAVIIAGTLRNCKRKGDGAQVIELLTPAYVHPGYDDEKVENDIAIAVTRKKIIFNSRVLPTCIHTASFSSKEDPIWIAGWGRDAEDGDTTPLLNKVFVRMVDVGSCKRALPNDWISDLFGTQICTYRLDRDACSGDSGGPLLWLDPRINRLTQIALVSKGLGCARTNIPAVNTAIYPYLKWMRETLMTSSSMHPGVSNQHFCEVVVA